MSERVHLHVHTEYSLMDGANRIDDVIRKVQAEGHTALAMTDHANMFGAVEFYTKCHDAGIKPILGAEVNWQGGERTADLQKEHPDDLAATPAYHLVLLAKTYAGYQNLCRVVSAGYLNPAYPDYQDVPIIQRSSLTANGSDLIALSSCLHGEFATLVNLLCRHTDHPIQALTEPTTPTLEAIVSALRDHVDFMRQCFGENGYFIELIDNNLARQKLLLPVLVETARFFGLPVVATCDSHYLNPDDAEAHAVLTGVKNDLTMSDIRARNRDVTFHLRSDAEMEELFGQWPEALASQKQIAEQCNVELTFGKYFLPKFELPNDENIEDGLRRLASEGLEERLVDLRRLYGPDELTPESEKLYWERLDYELGIIFSMGFPGYFLIVQDFINWAKDHGIPVGPGRGSGAGSLVAYALRITDLDPLKFNLIFERFLNPERVSMPDFDVDFCQDRRDEVIHYVTEKYGSENVAQITTFGKMKAKAALRDVGRVLELGYSRVDRIAKLIPNELDIKLQDALDREPRIWEEARKDETVESMIKLALKIEGMNRHTSVHAAGVVISEGGMENYVPVYLADGALITQYEMKNAEKVGLVKFDFLGLKTLTVIDKAVELIRYEKDPEFDINKIDLEKKEVYDLISSAHSVGIFQLESSGMQALLHKLRPSRFEDIIAVVALFRPGPLGSGMVDDFIERKHGRQEITYLHPNLESILDDTYGIILYQEQVQKIAASLANYSLGEADLLRRAMGKKKPEEMAKQKVRFASGCRDNGIDDKIAEEIFELMAMFAAYGFNKSHSAAYGLVSYQTAYLKTFYPEEFKAAIMTCDLDNTDKLARYVEECRRLKFKIYPPDINRSFLEFDVPTDGAVGYGLAAIKGVGSGSIEVIVKEREANGPYRNLTDLAQRVNLAKVGKKTLECLVQAGALDSFGASRSALTASIAEMVKYSESHHLAKSAGQRLLFADDSVETDAVDLAQWEEKLRLNADGSTQLDWLLKERKMLGVFLSGHPLDLYQEDQKKFGRFKLKDYEKHLNERKLPLVALLTAVSERLTKTNKKMAYIMLEDETASCEAVMFSKEIPEEFPPPNTVVVAYVSISKSFDGTSTSVRVESLVPLENVRREMIKRAHFKIRSVKDPNSNDLKAQQHSIQQLKKLIEKNPGETPYSLNLDFGDAQLAIESGRGGIDLNDLFFQNIKRLHAQGIVINY